MPNPGLSKKDADRTHKAIMKALDAGYAPRGAGVKAGEKSAISAAADAMGVPRKTIVAQVTILERTGYNFHWEKYRQKRRAVPTGKPAETVELLKLRSLQDENNSLRKAITDLQRDAIDSEAIRQILGGIAAAKTEPPDWLIREPKSGTSPHVPMTIWSDWHAGEVVSFSETNGTNEFDMKIFDRRVRRLVETTVHLCRDYGPKNYPGVVINLLGDMVSGALHPELLKTDEEEIIPCALKVRDILVWALGCMADHFGKVFIPCTPGNHGRNTLKPQFKRTVFENFDWLIYQLLARHFEKDKRITFMIHDSGEAHYRVFGQRYLAMHGDMLGVKGGDGIIGTAGMVIRGAVKVGKQASAMGRDFDILLMGHFHSPLWLPGIIVAGTLKGFDEYAGKALRAVPTIPSQPLWFVHPKRGIVSRMEVYLEDNEAVNSAEWISWRGAA